MVFLISINTNIDNSDKVMVNNDDNNGSNINDSIIITNLRIVVKVITIIINIVKKEEIHMVINV